MLLAGYSAQAQLPDRSAHCDLPCVFDTLWSEVERTEPKQQTRLQAIFLQTLASSNDSDLIGYWENRLGAPALAADAYEDYALKKVAAFLDQEGWDAFFQRARSRAHPFNTGRPEMMAAAAQHLADGETAERILKLMEDLAKADVSQAAFERASFGHALAEAAMRRCDVEAFDRALRLTNAPDSLRYAVWRTRMDGHPGQMKPRIDALTEDDRAVGLRQVLDGLSDVLTLGPCEDAVFGADETSDIR